MKQLPLQLNTHASQRLVSEMIAVAVEDFKKLSRKGYIVNGKPKVRKAVSSEQAHKYRLHSNEYKYAADVKQLIHFFTGGALDEWIALAGLNVCPDVIRRRIGLSN